MFEHLKSIVDLIRSGIADIRKFKTEKEREQTILSVLKTYFFLKDCVDEGEVMITDAGPDPVGKIRAMQGPEALATLERWDEIIDRQTIRLRVLNEYIFWQDHLTVINPALQDKIKEIIGYKMDRGVTLHGIGAALSFRSMFPLANTNEERAGYVLTIAGAEQDVLDMARIRSEIEALRNSLDQYRRLVERLVPDEELLRLSRRARQETRFSDGA